MSRPLTVNYTIPVGSYIKIGNRDFGTTGPFDYVPQNPFYNASPYTYQIESTLVQEIELTTVCGNCSNNGTSSNSIYIMEGDPPLP